MLFVTKLENSSSSRENPRDNFSLVAKKNLN